MLHLLKHPYSEDVGMMKLWGEERDVSPSSSSEAAAAIVEDRREAALSKYSSRPPESTLGLCVT